jgi:hypothetical protein
MNVTPPPERDPESARRFRITLVRVMAVQVITLALLWLLQQHFAG